VNKNKIIIINREGDAKTYKTDNDDIELNNKK